VPEVQKAVMSKLYQPKPLSKFIKRISSIHPLPPDATPNLSRRSGFNTISYLVRRRYIEENISKLCIHFIYK
jgi:hypothetical protein